MHLNPFETLADPTRRRIVEALRDGERQVNDIVRQAGIHQSGVSRHLRILHDAGFVSVQPNGQRRLYALRPEPFRELEFVARGLSAAVGGPSRPLWRSARETTQRPRPRQCGATIMSDTSTSAADTPQVEGGHRAHLALSGPTPVHVIDFIAGVEPYDGTIQVDFAPMSGAVYVFDGL